MLLTPRRLSLVALAVVFASTAGAHPGHDGHELTWELSHLAAHPVATVLCLGVLALGGWAIWRAGRSAAQSLRGSQARRGK